MACSIASGSLWQLASGVANHFGICTDSRTPCSSRLAATAKCNVDATRASLGSMKTIRRKKLRTVHKDRVQQAVFVIECQLGGIRRELADLRAAPNCIATCHMGQIYVVKAAACFLGKVF